MFDSGVDWVEMHKLANKIILEELIKIGILKGDINEMIQVKGSHWLAFFFVSI